MTTLGVGEANVRIYQCGRAVTYHLGPVAFDHGDLPPPSGC